MDRVLPAIVSFVSIVNLVRPLITGRSGASRAVPPSHWPRQQVRAFSGTPRGDTMGPYPNSPVVVPITEFSSRGGRSRRASISWAPQREAETCGNGRSGGRARRGGSFAPLTRIFPLSPNSLPPFAVKNRYLVRDMMLARFMRFRLQGTGRQIIRIDVRLRFQLWLVRFESFWIQ